MSARSRLLLAAFLVLAASATAFAQARSAPSWGTSSESSEVVSAWDMQTDAYGTAWLADTTNNQYRYLTMPGTLVGGLHVPNGAVIDYIELDACDGDNTFQVTAGLARSNGATTDLLATVATGSAEASGCSRWTVDLVAPETVDTQTYDYIVYAVNNGFNGSETIGAVRVYYHLQVSPAPGTATFADVPTNHPFFQFVEALAASGITAGCGNGNFCPDAPLTRGQMAVFLSKALGLHWPVESGTN
jgi:S-layer family protein